jgi:hypothetical protein
MSDEKWDDEQWRMAVGHLLLCRKTIEECERCTEIASHVNHEPARTISELDRVR